MKLLAFVAAVVCCLSLTCQHAPAQQSSWVGSWASSQQVPEPANSLASEDLQDATLRQVVHLSLGGSRLRVHVSNAFGTAPLQVAGVHVARSASPAGSAVVAGSDHALTFAGMTSVVVPAGAEYVSDPLDMSVSPLDNLTISLYLPEPPKGETGHPGSRSTSYLVHGNQLAAESFPADAKKFDHWYQLTGVDVEAPKAHAVIALGDSITDGHAATTNGNDRWTDVASAGLVAQHLGVLNEGIGGNHMLTDGLGPNVLARLDRDVLAPAGAESVILLEGVNDLGGFSRQGEQPAAAHDDLVARLIGSYQQVILRAHARGMRVYGATVTPYTGSDYYHPAAANEVDRQKLNAWIRQPGHFDGVLDFDKRLADPSDPQRMLPAFDSGDHLHPSPAGYKAMGEMAAEFLKREQRGQNRRP